MHPLKPVTRPSCAWLSELACVLALLLLAVLSVPLPALAQGEPTPSVMPATDDERILNYVSDIEILEDSTLQVTETITVRALNLSINHGIYRDFPTVYNDTVFKRYHVGFILDEVKHNGEPSPYHLDALSNGLRIYIGSSDETVAPGEHEYTLKYRTIKQLGFYPEGDELYWNVTGTDWAFPIDHAEAHIKLPRDVEARALKLNAYTGPFRSTGQKFSVSVVGKREVQFRTTEPLPAYGGLTVVVGFPKGIVTPPGEATLGAFWREQHKAEVFAMFGVPAVLVFFFVCWLIAGVDPRRGVVTPRTEPPERLSPAALRYVRKMGTDFTCFTAAVTNLATKGYITIAVDAENKYTLTQVKSDFTDAYPEEVALAQALFSGGSVVLIDQDNHSRISSAQGALTASLRKQHRNTYFYLNRALSFFGFLLSLAVLFVIGSLAPTPELVLVPLLLGALVLLALNVLFWNLLPRYTLRGRRLLDELEGFRYGLQYGSEAALGIKGENSEQLLEKYLGYAIALDAHQEWAKRLEQTLRDKGVQPRYFGWYVDPYYTHGRYNYYDLTHNLAKSFTSSVSSASVAPGSSSGSSGGSSGGGGGGGGGGGW